MWCTIRELNSLFRQKNSLFRFHVSCPELPCILLFRSRRAKNSTQNCRNPCKFPCSRDFPGEWLAPDCPLRHAVWSVEKNGCIPAENRISPEFRNFHPRMGPEKVDCIASMTRFERPFLPRAHRWSPSTIVQGECNAIRRRIQAKDNLTS